MVQPVLSPSAIILSETKTNNDLLNAGYSIKGVTNLQYSLYENNSFGWYTQINKFNAPTERQNYTALWTGSNMLIWGGYFTTPSIVYKNDGGIYNPITENWSNIANSPLTGRHSHIAIWTGSKMIIWGGESSSGTVNNGAIYDVASNTWNMMSAVNAPTQRAYCFSVWTGSVMLVWSGINTSGGVYSNDGKIYDPNTDTWTSMSTINAPSGRAGGTGIWTGNKMIVWGGQTSGSNATNTGGIYDLATNTWVSMTTIAPSGLNLYSAIWSGSKMIIFGGSNISGNVSNSCNLYNPMTDTSTTANTTNVPLAREGHSAIWTGNKMIVFGGENVSSNLTDGGIYDPTSNSWESNNITLPDFKYKYHSAIWTGEDMIIFGASPGHILKKDFQTSTGKAMYLYQKN